MTENRKKLLNGGIIACLLLGMVSSMLLYIWGPRAGAEAAGGKLADAFVSDAFMQLSRLATLGFGGLAAVLAAFRLFGR